MMWENRDGVPWWIPCAVLLTIALLFVGMRFAT